MNSKIIKQQKNPFLEREEITLEIKNEVAPSYDEVKTAIGKDPALTVIKKINTSFGDQTFITEALIYDNIEAKKKIETISQKIRKKIETDEKAIKEAEKKAEEAPVEELKEEPKEEPKPEPTTNN